MRASGRLSQVSDKACAVCVNECAEVEIIVGYEYFQKNHCNLVSQQAVRGRTTQRENGNCKLDL